MKPPAQDVKEKRQTMIPSDGQRVADDSLTATGVLNVHRDGRRVGHVSETTLRSAS